LHWTDRASLIVLERVLREPCCRHVFVVGAQRTNGDCLQAQAHLLARIQENSDIRIGIFDLHELELETATDIIADLFRCCSSSANWQMRFMPTVCS
jgi:hypothetical protein